MFGRFSQRCLWIFDAFPFSVYLRLLFYARPMDFRLMLIGCSGDIRQVLHFPIPISDFRDAFHLQCISDGFLLMFEGSSIDVNWMFGRSSIDAPFPILYLPFPISHFPFHIFISLFDRPLPISHCRWLGLAECAERLNPPPLPYGKELALSLIHI